LERDYYCSQKFDWLEIRLYDGYVASCCQSEPSRVTLDLLRQDDQAFFNWPEIVVEREKMLQNLRIPGCENSCWKPEDQSQSSRRTEIKIHPRYSDTKRLPRTLNLVVNNTCNLTCSYCCKNFSSAWLRDVVTNGNYDIDLAHERYNADSKDQLLHRVSQKTMALSTIGQRIMEQIELCHDQIDEILVSGGEPLLYQDLESLLDLFQDKKIQIYTGLGVPRQRVRKLLPLLERPNVRVTISAENTGCYHEFNRYGTSYQDFLANLELFDSHPRLNFASTISNLTVLDFAQFADRHRGRDITLNYVFEPGFMHPSVLDHETKSAVLAKLHDIAPQHHQRIASWLAPDPPAQERDRLRKFLLRFASVRHLDFALLPLSLRSWLDIER
jgi:organic radical activating enzyme